MRMFSGSEDYMDQNPCPKFALIKSLESQITRLQDTPKGVWVIQNIGTGRVVEVFRYSVPLTEIVKIYPCVEFMHTYREVKEN